MKKKPDLNSFLSGGAAAAAEASNVATIETPVILDGGKITKTIRLSKSMDLQLKAEAYKRSTASGRRVAESDLIELALIEYLQK